MSGASGEKTELPTPKKERDARRKGQVARSQEVVTAVSLMSVVAYLWFAWGEIMRRLAGLFDQVAVLTAGDFRVNALKALDLAFRDAVALLLPVIGITILAGIAANYLQIGSVFAFESIMPKLEKVNPGSGFKRIFSMKQLVDILKSVAKIALLSVFLYYVIRDAIGPFVSSVSCDMPCLVNNTATVIFEVLLYSALVFIVVALADFAYQRHAHTKSLMMSKDEVKREYKESEGDPHIKGHRRQLAQEMAMSDGGHAARKGTAVVINPTHLAVVLSYRPDQAPLPLVTAKGRNLQAHHLRSQAEAAGVPIFRNVGLARALFAAAEVNDTVPDELFDAVAEVLAWVARHEHLLYAGRLDHGVIDMDVGDHRAPGPADAARAGAPAAR